MSWANINIEITATNKASREFETISKDSASMSRSIRSTAREIASLGASAIAIGKLGEQFGILNKEQADVITTMGSMVAMTGTVVRGLSYVVNASWAVTIAEKARGVAHGFADAMASGITKIGGAIVGWLASIAASSWAVTIAEKARAIAHAVAHALSGPIGWAILAASAVIAAGAIALTTAIPSRQFGGPIHETGIYMLHAGEYVLPKGFQATTIGTVNFYISGATSPRATAEAVLSTFSKWAERRRGVETT